MITLYRIHMIINCTYLQSIYSCKSEKELQKIIIMKIRNKIGFNDDKNTFSNTKY